MLTLLYACFKVFLSQVEDEHCEINKQDLRYPNLFQEQWRAIRSLADDRSIVTKKADKGSCTGTKMIMF